MTDRQSVASERPRAANSAGVDPPLNTPSCSYLDLTAGSLSIVAASWLTFSTIDAGVRLAVPRPPRADWQGYARRHPIRRPAGIRPVVAPGAPDKPGGAQCWAIAKVRQLPLSCGESIFGRTS